MLDVVAGYDPADPVTAYSVGKVPETDLSSLLANALDGARIGLLVDVIGTEPVHTEVNAVVDDAVYTMERLGAEGRPRADRGASLRSQQAST